MGKFGVFTIADMKKFKKQLEKIEQNNINAFAEKCAKELAARFLAKVIKRTPVGVKPKFEGEKTVSITGQRKRRRRFISARYAAYRQAWDGYVGGTLRRGWTCRTHEEAVNGGNKDIQSCIDSLTVQHMGNNIVIEIINPVEYASYVEYGHRQTPGRYVPALGKRLKRGWVEGKFMMTKSAQEVRNIAPKVLENKIKNYLKECFK